MKDSAKLTLWGLTSFAILFSAASVTAQSVTTDPVGYVTNEIPAVSSEPVYVSVSRPFHSGDQGSATVASVTGSIITTSSSAFEAGAFSAVDSLGASLYYIVVTTPDATNEGLVLDVVSNTADSITVDASGLGGDVSGVISANDTLIVRKYSVLSDLFGASNDFDLNSGQDDTSSDIIYVMSNDGVGTFSRYYYQTDAFSGLFGGDGWRAVGDINTDHSNLRLAPDSGVFIKRISGGALSLVTTGVVSDADILTPLVPGFNLISSTYAIDSTLSTLGLYSNGSTEGVVSGQDDQTSDIVYVLNPDGTYARYYYQTDAFGGLFGGDGWRAVGDINTPKDSVEIPAGSAIIVNHIGSGNNWATAAPYSL